ncbi:MAG: maleylpyruvate isomerase N-terminal domain-containing protein [Chloroflexota bacterium]
MDLAAQIAVVRTATDHLHTTLTTLAPKQWETPNACGVWNVAEVVAHLAWGAGLYSDLIRQGLAEDVASRRGSDAPVDRTAMNAHFAEIAAGYRRELGDRLLDVFAESGRALAAQFARLGPADWERAILHPSGLRPMRQLLIWRVMELSIHGWEIRRRLGLGGRLPEDSQQTLIELAANRMRSTFDPRELLPEPLRYLFVLTSPLLRTIHLTIYGDRFELDPEMDQSGSDVVVTLHPDTYILLFMGRLTWREAIGSGAVSATGRQDLAVDLSGWFR